MTFRTSTLSHALPLALAVCAGWALAAGDTPPVSGKPLPVAAASASRSVIKSTTLPASGLFEGDRLSTATKARLDAMLANATDLDVEVALLMPSGPWKIDGKSVDEQSLTPARLAALRLHLTQRGLPAKRIYVESRIDRSATEPKLVIELVGTPAPQ
jgi:OOP family OmpA-OmpF porin